MNVCMQILILCSLLLLSLTGCASHQISPKSGSYLDATTTYIALSDNFTEANPILNLAGNPLSTALASVGIKHISKHAIAHSLGSSPEHEYLADTIVEAAGVSAGSYNLMLILGANPVSAIPVGILSGYWYWRYRDRKYREEE